MSLAGVAIPVEPNPCRLLSRELPCTALTRQKRSGPSFEFRWGTLVAFSPALPGCRDGELPSQDAGVSNHQARPAQDGLSCAWSFPRLFRAA